jgi:hypothetical protein
LDVGKQGVKDGDLVGGMLCADGFPRVVDDGDAPDESEHFEALVVRLTGGSYDHLRSPSLQVGLKATSNHQHRNLAIPMILF